MTEIWTPEVTVAAVIEREGRFFMIEEDTSDGRRFNQPAGHLDPDESLIDAVIREAKEETAHEFTPTHLIGTYLIRKACKRTGQSITYLRFAFAGQLGKNYEHPLDTGIVSTMWMTYDEIVSTKERHRSELVLKCIDDYLAEKNAPLSFVYTANNVRNMKPQNITDINETRWQNGWQRNA